MSGNSSYAIKCLCLESVIIFICSSISWRVVQQFLAGMPHTFNNQGISKSGNVLFAILRTKINNLLNCQMIKLIWQESQATIQFGNKLEHLVISAETGLICDRDVFLD